MKTLKMKEAVKHLNMSPYQIRNLIKNDESFPVHIRNQRSFYFDVAELNIWQINEKKKTPERKAQIKAKREARQASVIPAQA